MSQSLKKQFLTIKIPSDQFSEEQMPHNDHIDRISQHKLQRISSTKNVHQMKKFIFINPAKINYDRIARQQKIQKLQKQKQSLLKSLQILKNGAVQCIVQKDQTIAKLRSILTDQSPSSKQTRVQQIDKLLQYIRDLQDQRAFLQDQLQIKRKQYKRDIEDKDDIINELHHQLNWSASKIESLQQYDKLLQQKIQVMQADNQNLSVLLNQSQQSNKVGATKSFFQNKQAQNILIDSSQVSDIQANDSINSVRQNRSSSSLINHIDDQLVQCKIRELKHQHQLQITDLTNYYQSRIQTLKQACDQSLEYIPLLNLSSPTYAEKNPQNISMKSIYSISNGKDNQPSLKKKLSLTSFRSQNFMQTIDEREQLHSPRKSLKQQIPMDENQFFLNRLSRKSIYSQSDKKSQAKSEHSFKFYEIPSKEDQNSNRFKKKKQDQKGQKWQKAIWFTLGTIAGGSILTIGQKLFK